MLQMIYFKRVSKQTEWRNLDKWNIYRPQVDYSGDLNTDHLKLRFQMVTWYSDDQLCAVSYVLDRPFEYQIST